MQRGIIWMVCLLIGSAVIKNGVVIAEETKGVPQVKNAVGVWMTLPDRTKLLQKMEDIHFDDTGDVDADFTICVNENVTYQQMDGFGASFTDASAWLLNWLEPEARNSLMESLFDPDKGIGISMLRQPMGATDYATKLYSFDESTNDDFRLKNFSIEHDKEYILPLLRQAFQLNPALKVIASPWSPPGWMKTTGSMIGGKLRPEARQAFADYFVKFIQAYQKEKVPLYAITIQNEPGYASPKYPGTVMTADEQIDLIKDYIGPTLKKNKIKTKLLCYDFNWTTYNVPIQILSNKEAAKYVDGVAWHYYSGSADVMSIVQQLFPDKGQWFTEGSDGNWIENPYLNAMGYIIRIPRNWAKSVVWWNLALNETNGPTILPKSDCWGAVTVNMTNRQITYNWGYYSLGHVCKFVKSGAYRIDSDSQMEYLESVAYMNTDRSKALVLHNRKKAPCKARVQWGGKSFIYTLPPYAAVTFKWDGKQESSGSALFQDFEKSGFKEGKMAQVEAADLSDGLNGKKSVKLTVLTNGNPVNDAQCVCFDPQGSNVFNAAPYHYLHFYVKDTLGDHPVKVSLFDNKGHYWSGYTDAIGKKDKWTKITLPLNTVEDVDKSRITEMRLGEDKAGEYYFDDAYFSDNPDDPLP